MEFKGIKARLEEADYKAPKRRGRKKQQQASIDLSNTLTREQADAFLRAIDEIMHSTQGHPWLTKPEDT